MAAAPTPIVPVGLSTQREVDALFSDAKHFTSANTRTAKVSTGISIEYAVHTTREATEPETDNEDEHLLFIMGFMEGKESWAPIVDLVLDKWAGSDKAKHLTMVTFDNRGMGGTTSGWGYNSTSIMAGDALALMDHLGWKQAHVVGLSMGGMISLELATTAPQRLRSLSLIVTTRGRFETAGATSFFVKTVMSRDQEALLQMTLDFFYPKDFLDKQLKDSTKTAGDVLRRLHEEKMTNMKPHSVGGYMGQILAIRTHFVSDERLVALGKASVPIMAIGCAGDELIPAIESVKLRNLIGADHVRLIYYANAAHCVPRQCPDEVSQQIFATIAAAN